MKVAVTSQNFRTVTGHAGMTRRFIVFDAAAGSGVAEVTRLDLPKDMAFHGFAGGPHPIDGVEILVTGGAGDGFVAKMAARGIRVVQTGQADPRIAVEEVLRGEVTPPLPHDHDAHGHAGGCGCGHGAH
ncbi:MAG: nitrogen fixation protein [Betaproteobacteria bacterium]|nr:nitrogen fixation protein [Betaproteobacteria bacterium]